MLKKYFFLAVTCFFTVIVLSVQGAGIPQMINYQGVLLDGGGDPITGNRSVEFLLYDVETGGTAIWSETQNLTITEGLFNVLLGSVTPIPFRVFDDTEVYLALKVGSDSEMVPRKKLVSVGFAYHANSADSLGGKAASDFIKTGSVNIVSSVDGVVNNKGNIDLVEGSNINITPDDASNTVTIATTLPTILSSLDGVSNNGGNIDLIEGSNITITPNDGANTITIAAAGGPGGDDLGNHTATENIKLNSHWLSNDGGNEGVSVQNDGDIVTSGDASIGGTCDAPTVTCNTIYDPDDATLVMNDNVIINGECQSPNIDCFNIYDSGDNFVDVNDNLRISANCDASNVLCHSIYDPDDATLVVNDNVIINGECEAQNIDCNNIYDSGDNWVDVNDNLRINSSYWCEADEFKAGDDIICGVTFRAESGNGIFDPDDNRLEVKDNLFVTGSITKTGTVSDVMTTQSYGNRKHYSDESTEVYHFDRGQGQLQNGEAIIYLDPVYLETVIINNQYSMLVQITLTADCKGAFIAERTATYFKVKELQAGTSNATFNWEVAAKRRGYEDVRMEQVLTLSEEN